MRRPARVSRWEILSEIHRLIRQPPNDRKDSGSAPGCQRRQVRRRESWDQNDNFFPFLKRIARFRRNHNNAEAKSDGAGQSALANRKSQIYLSP